MHLDQLENRAVDSAAVNCADLGISFATSDLARWQRWIVSWIENRFGKRKLLSAYQGFLSREAGRMSFWDNVKASLSIDVKVHGNTAETVPAEGGLLVVANHPYGVIDGAAIAWTLAKRRTDFKVILWDIFDQTETGKNFFLPMDLTFNSTSARKQNINVRREATRYLKDGHMVLVFPGGGVESIRHPLAEPQEAPWNDFTSRMAIDASVPVLPIFVSGHNSRLFHLCSYFSYTLRLSMFFREISRKMNSTVELVIGDILQPDIIRTWPASHSVADKLRDATLGLASLLNTSR